MPITKHNFIVRRVEDLAQTLRRAFAIATEGRPGPVLVDVLKDAQQARCPFEPAARAEPAPAAADPGGVHEALRMIAGAARPVIFAGGGVIHADAAPELFRFAERVGAPVSLSLMGLGAYPADDARYIGMLGMHGTRAAANAVSHADLLIVCGARFSDRVVMNAKTFAPRLRVLHLDIDRAEINKNIRSHHHICGDIKAVLTALCEGLGVGDTGAWLSQIAAWKEEEPCEAPGGLTPWALIDAVRRAVPDDAIIATDVGQHQMWVAQRYRFSHPRTLLTSGGLGAMGYGLGAAIGAQIARPDRRVVLFTGDGSFHMNFGELSTVAAQGLPIVVVVMNNGVLGMVRQWQKVLYGRRYSETSPGRDTDFVKLADAFGIAGARITQLGALDNTIQQVVAARAPFVLDVRIDPDENVLPMVMPGHSFTEQIIKLDRKGGAL